MAPVSGTRRSTGSTGTGPGGNFTWRKLHLAVNPDSGEILASELTTKEMGDLSMVGPLLEQIQCPLLSVRICQNWFRRNDVVMIGKGIKKFRIRMRLASGQEGRL